MFGWLKKNPPETSQKSVQRDFTDSSAFLNEKDGVWIPNEEAFAKFVAENPEADSEAFTALSRDWLERLNKGAFAGALSSGESKNFILVGDVAPTHGKNILAFAEQTLQRYLSDFGDIAQFGPASKMPILALTQQDDYYRLISAFFDEGTYGLSSGLFVSQGFRFFVFPNEEMWALEAVIAHELLHAVMQHLPIPAWLNEGLAVNAEFRYGNRFSDPRRRDDLVLSHRKYWNDENLRKFLCGDLFHSDGEGQELSYDLARRLVLGLSNDWAQMKRFILNAHFSDAGEAAARETFGLSLAIPIEAATGVATQL
jgi:hypothetical protein